MKEQLITLKTAKLAKQKGFAESCYHFYSKGINDSNLKVPYEYSFRVNANTFQADNFGYGQTWSAPSQSLLQRWLREVHLININCMWQNGYYELLFSKKVKYNHWDLGEDAKKAEAVKHSTYELCLEAGLYEALKLLPDAEIKS